MSISLILVILATILFAGIFGKKLPGIGLFSGILLILGIVLGSAAPLDLLASWVGKVKAYMPSIWGAIKSKIGLEKAGSSGSMSQKEYFVTVSSLAGGIAALAFFKRYLVPLAAGFLLGLILRVSLAYFGISLGSLGVG